MTQFVADLPLEFISANGGNDTARSLLKAWVASEGQISADLASYLSVSVLLNGDPQFVGSPDILFAGRGSLAVDIMGTDWADKPNEARKAFDPQYRDLVGEGYRKSSEIGLPTHDFVAVKHGATLLKYKRLILPVYPQPGGKLLLCYSFDNESEIRRLDPVSATGSRADRMPQNRVLQGLFAPAA